MTTRRTVLDNGTKVYPDHHEQALDVLDAISTTDAGQRWMATMLRLAGWTVTEPPRGGA